MPSYRSASITRPSAGQASEGPLVVANAGTHRDGELQVSDRAHPLPGALARERQAEMRVVVDGIDGDGLRELAASPTHTACLIQRPGESLTDGGLLRFHQL